MRDLVNRPSFLFRKYLDNLLYKIVPSFWVPLYQSVTFSNMDYKQCISNKKWQDSVNILIFKRVMTQLIAKEIMMK